METKMFEDFENNEIEEENLDLEDDLDEEFE